MAKDTRIVYGARCSWWDSIDKVGNRDGIPCCPHCLNVLFEMSSIDEWQQGVDKYNLTHTGYAELVAWARGKCFPSFSKAAQAYRAETGKEVSL